MIGNLFLNLDFVGPKPTLYIDNYSRFRTTLGGVMSIILAALTILCFIGFGMDLFERKKPSTFLSKVYDTYPKMNYSNFKFLLAPAYPGPKMMKNITKKLSFMFTYHQADATVNPSSINYTYYDMVPCTEINFFEKNPGINPSLLLQKEDYYCVPENFNAPLEGKFGNSKFKMYHINVNFCNNITMNNTCNTVDDIKTDLAEFYIHYVYVDNYIDQTDFSEPVKILYSSELLQGSAKAARTDQYWYKKLNIFTDSGWILEEVKELESYQLDTRNNFINAVSPRFIYLIQISLNTLRDIYKRRYVKVQDIFANIGGIIKSMMILLLFFNDLFVEKLFYQYFYLKYVGKENSYRPFSEGNVKNISFTMKKDEINTLHTGLSLFKNSNVNVNLNLNNNINSSNNDQKNAVRIKANMAHSPHKIPSKKHIRLTCCELVGFSNSDSYKEKLKLLENIYNLQKKSLNVFSLVKSLQTVKIIKKMFFGNNSNLLNLFTYSNIVYNLNNTDKIKKAKKPFYNNEEIKKIRHELKNEHEVFKINNILLNQLNGYLDE